MRNDVRIPVGERVYDELLERIISGRIRPGEKLSVDGLARTLGVSQTPIRRALAILEAEGLVTNSYLSGFTASARLTRSEFADLFELRQLIEPAAAGLTAKRATPDQVDEIVRLGREMAGRASRGELVDYSAFARLDSQFHGAIVEATGNGMLRRSFEMMHAHVHMFRLLFDRAITSEAVAEHDAVIDAITRHDAPQAALAMRHHLRASQLRLSAAF